MNSVQVASTIKRLCNTIGVPINQMLNDCGIRKSLIYDMEKRNTIPSTEILEKLADYFDCSIDYLLGRTDIKKAPSAEDEDAQNSDIRFIKLTECYNKLNDTGKQKAVEAVSDLTEIDKYTNDNLSDDPVKKERYVIGHTAAFGGNTHDTLIPESDLDEIERLKFKLREKRIDSNKKGKK